MITRDTVPCWYELSWREQPKPGIVLRIHTDFARNAKPIPPNAPVVSHFRKEFGFKQFGSELGQDLGFERMLKFLRESDQFLEYAVPASLCRKSTGDSCRSCGGTGKDEITERECLYCDGEGKEITYDYQEAFAVSASLTTLFGWLRFPEIETAATIPQLICVQTITICESHGGSLGGEYSRELVKFLRLRRVGAIPEMVTAMRATFKQMEGRIQKFYGSYFQAYTQGNDGWLNVSCPGDGTGLHPTSSSVGRRGGYEFSCHNVDNPMQQLTLLASLAVLHDLARREIR